MQKIKLFGLGWVLVGVTAVLLAQSPVTVKPTVDWGPYPWLMGEEATAQGVEIIAVGDVLLGRGVAAVDEPLVQVSGWLSGADLTLGNFESALVPEGWRERTAPAGEPQPIILNAPLTAVATLRGAGFDVLNLANNHTLDYGAAGLAATAVRLQNGGLAVVGAGATQEAAFAPRFWEVKGVRLALLGFDAVPEPADGILPAGDGWVRAEWDEAAVLAAVAEAKAEADVVIVQVHWGVEYAPQAEPWQATAVERLFAAGADVVLGHHPHVAQKVIVQGQKLAAFSLGNFVFDQNEEGLALHFWVDQNGVTAAQLLPIQAGVRPRLMTMPEGERILARVLPPLPRHGFACTAEACQAVAVAQGAAKGGFVGGAIDFTGDGVAEAVRLVDEQVTIYAAGTAVWQSPPTWQVLDVALGDPNNDGRYEMMVAILKADNDGYLRSHPYLVGYRGGKYDLMWGGRPVGDPIQELEVGDLDGDGTQELVVIEAKEGGAEEAIAVWRWTGWSFSLIWRSDYGRYQDLTLQPQGGQLIIDWAEEHSSH